ncbi:MAG: MaoC family dehydratase [Candidatus Tectimicrobiota bacterium]|nr:MAG: MaoC family dehydratase [Candidatus Tectomicrobia bacterium]
MAQGRFFEDFVLGETFALPSRTLSESHFLLFAAITGDNHPIHYDREYCRARGLPERLAHGYLVTIQTVLGASPLSPLLHESIVAFLEQSSRFLKPVFVGDTLYPRLTVAELTPRRTTGVVKFRATVHNQHEELVLEGHHAYLLKKRSPQA